MNGPSESLRETVHRFVASTAGPSPVVTESHLVDLLEQINPAFIQDWQLSATAGETDLAVIDDWAGLASQAVAAFYAPTDHWPHRSGSWGSKVIQMLRGFSTGLAEPLGLIAKAVGATSYTVSVSYPWGIAVGMTWDAAP